MKPLLAGLVVPTLSKPQPSKIEAGNPAYGKTSKNQPDFSHDPGNGYNPDSTFIQD